MYLLIKLKIACLVVFHFRRNLHQLCQAHFQQVSRSLNQENFSQNRQLVFNLIHSLSKKIEIK